MHKGVIIKLELTPEQEVYCKQTIGTTRWLYNDFLSKNFQLYEYFLENNTGPKHMSVGEFRNEMTKLGATELPWLLDTAYQTRYQAIKDADRALWDFIK